MRTSLLAVLVLPLALLILAGCGSTVVVDSGTYEGTIKKVEPEKEEIYVTLTDERVIELYFTEETELTRAGEPAEFGMLEAGQAVTVTIERVGNRLDPVSVEIQQ